MINRGANHVIFSTFDITERIRRPETIKLLEMLMWYYETWSRLNMFRRQNTGHGDTKIAIDQTDEFKKLMEATRQWLQPDEALVPEQPQPLTDLGRKALSSQSYDPGDYGLFPIRGSPTKTQRVKLARKRVPLK